MKTAIAAVLVFSGVSFSSWPVGANDSFAEVAAGGIKFLKRADIVLQKEVLTIRANKVEVAYRFFNPTDVGIRITVAFPLPAYSFTPDSSSSSPAYDFSVITDGRAQTFKTITQAELKGKNVTAEIQRAGLPLGDFRRWEELGNKNPSRGLSVNMREHLVARGLLDAKEAFPLWTASVSYVWEQRFPAGQVTEIRHTYTPQTGKNLFSPAPSDPGWSTARLPAGCTPSVEELKKTVRPAIPGGMIFQTWVAYILTTANNWQTPIGEFTLIVRKEKGETVVLCSDLPAPRVSGDSVEVSLKDYTPSRDLAVYFLAAHGPDETAQYVR